MELKKGCRESRARGERRDKGKGESGRENGSKGAVEGKETQEGIEKTGKRDDEHERNETVSRAQEHPGGGQGEEPNSGEKNKDGGRAARRGKGK